MEAFHSPAAYTSYSVSDFEATRSFYEVQLGCTPVIAWDRADGQGVYYELDHAPVVEILGARRGDAALAPPVPGSFSIVVVVTDADCAHKELIARGAAVTTPPVTETWGCYFGIEDPDGVPLYFVEQNSSS